MKNKLTIKILMTVTVLGFLTVWGYPPGAGTAVQAAAETAQDAARSSAASQAPAIQDKVILKGWKTLRGMHEQIQVGNGVVVSGESLALFLLESQIPVLWGSEKICGGGSCSLMYCASGGSCSYEDGQPGIDPIYLNPDIQAQDSGKMDRLVNELGHEIFHRIRPFGSGTITRLEEYWAFYVGAQLVSASFPKFAGTDPLNPAQLEHWFSMSGLNGYLRLPAYPGGDDLPLTDAPTKARQLISSD